jgi:peptide/nickel transport system permease protein
VSVAYDAARARPFLGRGRVPLGLRRVGAVISLAFIVILVAVALLAPLIAPHDPNEINPLASYAGPGSGHLLGADAAGRDILSRLMFGARLSLLGPFAVVVLSLLVGIPAGLVAGWRAGIVDGVLSRSTDALLAFPPLLLAIVITAAFGAGFRTAIIAIAITYIPLMLRVTRGLTLVERERTYVDELSCQGFGALRICLWHILPNIRRGIAAQATISFGYALIDLAALAFLGLGVQPPTADWGAMLSEGRQSLLINATEVTSAAVLIALTVTAFNVLGDALSSGERR